MPKVALLSDLHGQLPPIDEDVDFIILAGDIAPDGHFMGQSVMAGVAQQDAWLKKEFVIWREQMGNIPIYGTWGNHDFLGNALRNYNHNSCHIVTDQLLDVGGLKTWFCPWSKTIPTTKHWTFQRDESEHAYDDIPLETEVLISHGPPYGLGDLIVNPHRAWNQYENVGSPALLRRIMGLPDLRLLVCGHIHEARGLYGVESVGFPVLNVACLDHTYTLRPNAPVYIEWPTDTHLNEGETGYGFGV